MWDVRYIKEGADWYLKIFIDKINKNEYITIDECELVSKAVEEPIDKYDPIDNFYYLEVCSPGMERELIKNYHFKKFLNENVKIRLIRKDENLKSDNKKEIIGKLSNFDDDNIYILLNDGIELAINRKNISHVNVCDDFI